MPSTIRTGHFATLWYDIIMWKKVNIVHSCACQYPYDARTICAVHPYLSQSTLPKVPIIMHADVDHTQPAVRMMPTCQLLPTTSRVTGLWKVSSRTCCLFLSSMHTGINIAVTMQEILKSHIASLTILAFVHIEGKHTGNTHMHTCTVG